LNNQKTSPVLFSTQEQVDFVLDNRARADALKTVMNDFKGTEWGIGSTAYATGTGLSHNKKSPIGSIGLMIEEEVIEHLQLPKYNGVIASVMREPNGKRTHPDFRVSFRWKNAGQDETIDVDVDLKCKLCERVDPEDVHTRITGNEILWSGERYRPTQGDGNKLCPYSSITDINRKPTTQPINDFAKCLTLMLYYVPTERDYARIIDVDVVPVLLNLDLRADGSLCRDVNSKTVRLCRPSGDLREAWETGDRPVLMNHCDRVREAMEDLKTNCMKYPSV